MLALALFLMICPEHRVTRENLALAVLFVFFASMAVAGLWEISEYFVHAVTGRDVQRVALTGVDDTMQDMIVCMIGTLAYLPAIVRLGHGRSNVFTGPAEAFAAKNLPGEGLKA